MLVVFILLAALQFAMGVVFMALPENILLGRGILRGKCHSRGLTCHPRTVLVRGSDIWNYRVSYAYLSLGFGMDIPPLRFLGVFKHSCLRHHIIPDRDRSFLLDVWTEVELVDALENSGR